MALTGFDKDKKSTLQGRELHTSTTLALKKFLWTASSECGLYNL